MKKKMIPRPLLLLVSSLLGVAGNIIGLIAFNFWLRSFLYGSGAITVVILCAVFYVVLFVPFGVLALWRLRRTSGPAAVRVFFRWPILLNGLLIAVADTWISMSETYSAAHVPILTQVFAKSLEPIVTFLLTKVVFKEKRSYKHILPVSAFLCIALGVALHMGKKLEDEENNSKSTEERQWGFIIFYATGTIGSSCYSIAQSRYIRTAALRLSDALTPASMSIQGDDEATSLVADEEEGLMDTMTAPRLCPVRTVAVATSMCFTLLLTLVLGPVMDIIPGVGFSHSIGDMSTNLRLGFECVWLCPDNFMYTAIACGGWALVYIADTVLNHFSPTMNAMVGQLNAPIALVVLMVFPILNVGSVPSHGSMDVTLQVMSIFALVAGVAMFVAWECRTTPMTLHRKT